MSVLKFPEWQKLCEEALSERDSGRVVRRVVAAETAIFQRLEQLKTGPENVEVNAIAATLQKLRLFITKLPIAPVSEGKVVTFPSRQPQARPVLFLGVETPPPDSSGK